MRPQWSDRAGFYSVTHEMPDDISQEAIIKTIEMMNQNPNIDGILIQLPLPAHIDTTKILEVVALILQEAFLNPSHSFVKRFNFLS